LAYGSGSVFVVGGGGGVYWFIDFAYVYVSFLLRVCLQLVLLLLLLSSRRNTRARVDVRNLN
jgi:hypothetical protein